MRTAPMDGYLVQQPFADLIASGKKTWDVRVRRIELPRQAFYILATRNPHKWWPHYDSTRLGVAVAVARFRGVEGPFSVEELAKYEAKHRIPTDVLSRYARGRELWAMVVQAEAIEARPYRSRPGAVHLIARVELLEQSGDSW